MSSSRTPATTAPGASLRQRSSGGVDAGGHPKATLYADVYDPLTKSWFAGLERSPDAPIVIAAAAEVGLSASIGRLIKVFGQIVDDQVTGGLITDPMVKVVRSHQSYVSWEGHAAPRPYADDDEIRFSLSAKLKRNINLGVVESLIFLCSASKYAEQVMELKGKALEELLGRSRQLYSSLAVLHDEQEQLRLRHLAALDDYPLFPYRHDRVLDGEISIAFDRFVVGGTTDRPSLRFKPTKLQSKSSNITPLQRCPAQRLRTSSGRSGRPLNDVLWDLLVELFARTRWTGNTLEFERHRP